MCSALERRELLAAQGFRQVFRNKQLTLVYRQGELRGLERLEELGRNLYQAARQEAGKQVKAGPRQAKPLEEAK